mgnify:FL=1
MSFSLTISVLDNGQIRTFPLDVEPSDSFASLKLKIQEIENRHVDDQRFIYEGKSICEERPLSDYNVRENTKLHVVMRIRNRRTSPQATSL